MNKINCQYSELITLSGLDGSGKSTQIELLKDYLKTKDKTFFYFHAVDFSIANLCQKSKIKSQNRESVIEASWLQIQLRKIALYIDICRFKRLVKKLKVDYIISDRYFYDSVVNILFLSCHSERSEAKSRNLHDSHVDPSTSSRCGGIPVGMTTIEKYIPKPNFAFFIKVSPEKIMQRERKPDQGIEYLVAKEKLFEDRIKGWNMIVLNGEKEKEEILSEIKSKINV